MMSDIDGDSAQSLLALAASRGYTVTATQLSRWHRAGLLPRPKQRSKGRGNGTESVYPAGVADQFLALCELRKCTRSLAHLAWKLWWQGYEIDPAEVRLVLVDTLAFITKAVAFVKNSRNFDKVVEASSKLRMPWKFGRQVRKRIGTDTFPTFVRIMLSVITGTFSGYEVDAVSGSTEDDARIADRALYLDRARKDRVGAAGPVFDGESEKLLLDLQRVFDPKILRDALDSATDADLARARDEFRGFLDLIGTFGAMAEAIFGRGAFGIGVMARLTEEMRPREEVYLFLLWLAFRQTHEVQQGLANLASAASNLRDEGWPAYQLLQVMGAEVPAFRDALAPIRLREALRDPKKMGSLQAEVAALGAEHRVEMQAVHERHPELKHFFD